MKQVVLKAYARGIACLEDYAIEDAPISEPSGWASPRSGSPEAVVEGIEAAPAAFASVFVGNSFVGKLLVKVSEADG